MNSPKIIAHRGASGDAPENTLAAMRRAKALGANWVEFDVQLTADGQAVVFHDDELDRTTDGSGPLVEKTLAEIKQLDAGGWFGAEFTGERVPTVRELLQCLLEQGLAMNVEIKATFDKARQLVSVLSAILKTDWPAGLTPPLISSFDWRCLSLARELNLNYPMSILMHEWRTDWLENAKALHCVSVNVNEAILTKLRVEEIKQAGYDLLAYTVNTLSRARQLHDWGVDGFFIDYVDVFKQMHG